MRVENSHHTSFCEGFREGEIANFQIERAVNQYVFELKITVNYFLIKMYIFDSRKYLMEIIPADLLSQGRFPHQSYCEIKQISIISEL
jgi:hypothetical protein